MPTLLLLVIIFGIWFNYETRKISKIEADTKADFMEKERLANFTRKADIANLDYIVIPLESLPFSTAAGCPVKDEILDCEKNIIALSHKKILNLEGRSNTDIKMEFGVANLQALIQYDDNFSKLSRLLAKWGRMLYETGEYKAAEQVFSYAVKCKCDIEEIFILLAKIYRKNGNKQGITSLIEASSCFDEFRQKNIVKQISSI